MYACMYVCMYVCKFGAKSTYDKLNLYLCMHVCMHVCMYVCKFGAKSTYDTNDTLEFVCAKLSRALNCTAYITA